MSALGVRSADALAQAAKSALDGKLTDADDGLAVAQALSSAGRHDEAIVAYDRMTTFAPTARSRGPGSPASCPPSGTAGRLRMLEALHRARRSTRRMSACVPRSRFEGAREAARARARRPGRRALPRGPRGLPGEEEGGPFVGVQEVADRKLHWLSVIVLHPDGRVSDLVQYAREVVIPPRTQAELLESLPSLPGDSQGSFARVSTGRTAASPCRWSRTTTGRPSAGRS